MENVESVWVKFSYLSIYNATSYGRVVDGIMPRNV